MRVKLPLLVVACLLGSALLSPRTFAQAGGRANVPAPPTPPAAPATPTPPAPPAAPQALSQLAARASEMTFKVDFLLTRFQGEKKLASLPFTLMSQGGQPATLRSGSQVPIPSGPAGGVTYQSIGVSITIRAISLVGDGRYNVSLNFDDSSVAEANAPGSALGPVIRSNSVSSTVLVREGQPLQFSVATDKVSGETLKAELTLTVLK